MKTLTVPESHQLKIALGTLTMSKLGASISGGMSHKEAVAFLRKVGYNENDIRYRLTKAGHSIENIKEFTGE